MIRLKNHIPKILILPLIVLLTFSVYSSINKFEEKRELNKASEYMKFSIISSALIHELQRERGYSSGFIASRGMSFYDEVKIQRHNTDKQIKRLNFFLENFNYYIHKSESEANFIKYNKIIIDSLNNINLYRAKINSREIQISEIMTYFTDNINLLLELNEQIITINYKGNITPLIQSYIILMKIKEKAGIERALVSKVLGENNLSSNDFYFFSTLISAQNIHINHFINTAQQKYSNLLLDKLHSDAFVKVINERNVIYTKNIKNNILYKIKEILGYGGLIHHFKNYIIRGSKNLPEDIKTKYTQLMELIEKYKSIENTTSQELEQLNIIKKTFTKYMQNVSKVTQLRLANKNISEFDKEVIVNDTPALLALEILSKGLFNSQSDWFETSTKRINQLKNIEDTVAYDLSKLINKVNSELSNELILQALILIVVVIIIFLSFITLRELIEFSKTLNRAQENTRSGSYEYLIQDKILFWSDEHYKLLQQDKEKFKPSLEAFMIFVHPDDVSIIEDGMSKAIATKEIVFFEYRILLFDNTKMFVRSSAEVIKYSSVGKPLIMVGTITDISESKVLKQEIIDTQKDVLYTMGAISETRSLETGNHVKRVAEYSKLLYLLHGAKEDEAELLKMASPMHDIGKIAIPDHILNKPGKLTKDEWVIMQTHAKLGYEMLKKSNRKMLKIASIISLTHHEKYNGSGYPRGLIGEDIPLIGRITALADVFDALGSDRCYKPAWKLDDILIYIEEEKGKHFDPKLVDMFLENINMFIFIREKHKETDCSNPL
ncbi:MAG: nitrate- and nitrite sensing domain-containing protein [Sulfurimonas sp.]|nr:nitrate- and nitrite sensing domain-containing protein [Sulfurimonas sp.]